MKTIKFNLILDDKPVRNIEQLRENFSVEDILETYKNGLLKKWLKVRGYNKYLDKIEQLNETNDKEIIKFLINIFEMYVDEEELEQIMNIVDYINTKDIKEYIAMDLNSYEFDVDEYHKGYERLINSIYENKNNIGKLKAIIESIEERYIQLFKMDYEKVYSNLINKVPLSILIMLSNYRLKEELKKIKSLNQDIYSKCTEEKLDIEKILVDKSVYIKEKKIDGTNRWKIVNDKKVIVLNSQINNLYSKEKYNNDVKISDKNKVNIYGQIDSIGIVFDGLFVKSKEDINIEYILYDDIKKNIIEGEELINSDSEKYIKRYILNTEGYWKELESRDKKFMIISMPKDSLIREDENGKSYSNEINGEYKIFNGIEYSSKSDKPLIYMEV